MPCSSMLRPGTGLGSSGEAEAFWRLAFPEEPRIERHAAIHKEGGATDVIGLIRGKPGDCRRDVLGLADPAIGDELEQLP